MGLVATAACVQGQARTSSSCWRWPFTGPKGAEQEAFLLMELCQENLVEHVQVGLRPAPWATPCCPGPTLATRLCG